MEKLDYIILCLGVIGLLYTFWKSFWISKQDAVTDEMKKISSYKEGVIAFLKDEYKVLSVFVLCISLILFFNADPHLSNYSIAFSLVLGVVCSVLAGFIGMRAATKANVCTADAARTSLAKALNIASIVALTLAPVLVIEQSPAVNSAAFPEQNVEHVTTNVKKISEVTGKWEVDGSHSFVTFEIAHLGFSKVKGGFSAIEGILHFTEDIVNSSINISIDVNSINTGIAKRDEHLKNEDFFEATKYPKITFISTSIKQSNNGYIALGKLTLKNVTKDIELPFNLMGRGTTKWGDYSAYTSNITINRLDFNVSEESVGLGNDVNVEIAIESYLVNEESGK